LSRLRKSPLFLFLYTKVNSAKMTTEWTEVASTNIRMPEGYVGNLTLAHQAKLLQIWVNFFSVCDRATGTKLEGAKGESLDLNEWR
jgi:hypothetical protein